MMLRYRLVAMAILGLTLTAHAQQVNVVNQGTLIYIPNGMTVSIDGDYIDNSGTVNFGAAPQDESLTLDAPIFLSGTLMISGDIINNSSTGTTLIYEFENPTHTGNVILNGSGDQAIRGSNESESYFPNLIVNKPSGGVILNRPVLIDNKLTLTQGSVNLNSQTLRFGQHGQIADETETAKIQGYPGTIEVALYPINPSSDVVNYRGFGLGYKTNLENFADVVWRREHGPGNFNVADGVNVLRAFRMTTSTGATFPEIRFRYHQAELNGLPETNLWLYYSNDNGASWTRATSNTIDAVNNIVTATGVQIAPGGNNIMALASNTCGVANLPDVTITSVAPPIVGGIVDICDTQPLQLAIPEVGTNDYAWTTPHGTASISSYHIPAIDYATHTGNYSVFARNARGCEATAFVTVNVRAIPSAAIEILPDPATTALCFGNQLQFNDQSSVAGASTITGWDWNFDDASGETSDLQNPQFTYTTTGEKTPTLTVTSNHGCVSPAAEQDIIIDTLPVPGFRITDGITVGAIDERCEDIDVLFLNQSRYSDYAGDSTSALSYQWDLGDGNHSTDQHPLHQYLDHGTYTITLRTTADATLCYAEQTGTITIDPEPIPDFTTMIAAFPVAEACEGVYIDFVNGSAMPDGTGMTYAWDFADGETSSETSPVKQYINPLTYGVVLSVTSVAHGCAEDIVVPLPIHPAPKGTFDVADTDICLDEQAVLVNHSEIASGSFTNEWDFGDGEIEIDNSASFAHPYSQPQQYKITLTRTSDKGCTNNVSKNVIVHPDPVASFVSMNACEGKEIMFYNNSDIQTGTITGYFWDFNDGTTSTLDAPGHTFTGYGGRSVELTATSDFGCTNTFTGTATVYQNPDFDLGASITACAVPFIIDPSADTDAFLPSGSSYQWKNNSGDHLGAVQQLEVSASGAYFVTITSPSPEACTTTKTLPVFLFQPANLGADVHSCSSTILDAEANLAGQKALAENTTYEWRRGGVLLSELQTLNVHESGDYELTLTRTVAGKACSSVDEVHVEIDLPLAASLTAEQTICQGASVTLDAGVVADSYVWTRLNTGEQFSGPTLEVTAPGDYRLEITNGGCTAFATSKVIVSPGPSVSFATSSLGGCAGTPLTFTDYSYTDEGTISSRLWEFSDLTSQSDVAVVAKTFAVHGTYTVDLTVTTNNGCSSTVSQQVVISAMPIADFTIADACEGSSSTIINNSTSGSTAHWDFGDGTTSFNGSPVKSFEEDGTYPVTLEVTSNGCSATASHDVIVHPKPDVLLGETVTTCGTSIVLDAFNAGATFRWFDPENGNATLGTSQQYAVAADMAIGLEVTNSFGCVSSDVTNVVLNSPVTVDLGSDRDVCDEGTLDAGYFPGGQYLWNTSETTRELTVTSAGTYEVTVTDQNGCIANAAVNITVTATPSPAVLPANITLCSGTSTNLDAGTNPAYSYQWSTGEEDAAIDISAAGTYSVTVSEGNCSAVQSVLVTMAESPTVSFSSESECEDEWIVFENASSTTTTGLQYLWDFGDGSFSTQAEPSKRFVTSAIYDVTLTATAANGCSADLAQALEIFDVPVAEFVVADACSFNNLVIEDLTTSAGGDPDYHWDFGNGQVSNDIVPTYVYPAGGTYQLNLLVTTDQGCTDNYLREVQVGETPSLSSWISEITTCNPTVVLDAGNDGSAYLWNDASTDRELTVSASDTYSVLITSADGCSATATVDVVMNTPAIPLLADETEGCGSVLLDPVANAATYLWSTGAQSKTIVTTSPGSYIIQLITTDLCVSRDTTAVTVNAIPVIELGPSVQACEGETVEVGMEASEPVQYLWSTGTASAMLPVTTSGTYSVVLTTPKACTYSDEVEVVFHALPVDILEDDIEACGSIVLDAGNEGSTFLWSSGDSSQALTASASGTYTVTITNADNCVAEISSAVTILPVPAFSLGSDITICHGETTVLDPGNITGEYLWSTSEATRTITAGANGVYTLSVSNDLGCTGSDEIHVTVRPPLALDLGADRLLCDNAGQLLSAGIDNVSYVWGSSNGFESHEKVIQVTQSGNYWIEIVDAFSCSARDSVTVAPTTESITASFLAPTTVGQGDVVHFAQLSEPHPTTFHWAFGDGGLSTQENPTHRYFQTGDFLATLIVSNGVCSDTLAKTITVRNGRIEIPERPQLPELIEFLSTASYPNPTTGVVSVEVELTSQAEVLVAIYSIKGVPMDERRKIILKETFQFDISEESDGMYLVRLIAGGRARVLKVLKSGGYRQ